MLDLARGKVCVEPIDGGKLNVVGRLSYRLQLGSVICLDTLVYKDSDLVFGVSWQDLDDCAYLGRSGGKCDELAWREVG